jgi:single-strand DNA-binding protein
MSVNTIHIIGRLGKDPEMAYSGDGKPFTKTSVAVDRQGKGKETDWFNAVAFGKTAEFLNEYGAKGRKVYVEGRMQSNKWEKDGQTRTSWELIVNQVEFLDAPKQAEDGADAPD